MDLHQSKLNSDIAQVIEMTYKNAHKRNLYKINL